MSKKESRSWWGRLTGRGKPANAGSSDSREDEMAQLSPLDYLLKISGRPELKRIYGLNIYEHYPKRNAEISSLAQAARVIKDPSQLTTISEQFVGVTFSHYAEDVSKYYKQVDGLIALALSKQPLTEDKVIKNHDITSSILFEGHMRAGLVIPQIQSKAGREQKVYVADPLLHEAVLHDIVSNNLQKHGSISYLMYGVDAEVCGSRLHVYKDTDEVTFESGLSIRRKDLTPEFEFVLFGDELVGDMWRNYIEGYVDYYNPEDGRDWRRHGGILPAQIVTYVHNKRGEVINPHEWRRLAQEMYPLLEQALNALLNGTGNDELSPKIMSMFETHGIAPDPGVKELVIKGILGELKFMEIHEPEQLKVILGIDQGRGWRLITREDIDAAVRRLDENLSDSESKNVLGNLNDDPFADFLDQLFDDE